MPTVKGKSEVHSYIAQQRAQIEEKLLRGAAREAAKVVAEEAKSRSISSEVAAAVKIATKAEETRIIAKVQVKGPGAYIAPWLEYGTDPHFIHVSAARREGRSVRRINTLVKQGSLDVEGSLVINGAFVGDTVHHPGAGPHPFLRPALDAKEGEAIAAAQGYINARVTKAGIKGAGPESDDA